MYTKNTLIIELFPGDQSPRHTSAHASKYVKLPHQR